MKRFHNWRRAASRIVKCLRMERFLVGQDILDPTLFFTEGTESRVLGPLLPLLRREYCDVLC